MTKGELYLGLLRPKTLLSGLSSVLVPIAYAYSIKGTVSIGYSSLLILIALSAQISSNIANDLWDYKKGGDTSERKGPLRPLSQGLLSIGEVKLALAISFSCLLFFGILLSLLVNPYLLLIGLAVALGLFAYSAGPFPLSRKGLGEVAVFIFFGLIPVLVGAYVLGIDISIDKHIYLLASSLGFASSNILLVNNYRDYEEDRRGEKHTLTVLLGKPFTQILYLLFAGLSLVLILWLFSSILAFGLLSLYLLALAQAYKSLLNSSEEELNKTLALTARNVLFLALLISILLLL